MNRMRQTAPGNGVRWLLFLAALLLASGHPTLAQDDSADRDYQAERWTLTLDVVEGRLADAEVISQNEAQELNERLSNIASKAKTARDEAREAIDPLKGQLDALGPPPGEGEAEESPEVAEKRQSLEERLAAAQGQVQRLDVVIARSQDLLKRLARARSSQFAAALLERGPQPIDPAVWGAAGRQAFDLANQAEKRVSAWWQEKRPERIGWAPYLWALAVGLGALAVSVVIGRLLVRNFGVDRSIEDPSYARAILAAGVEGLTRGLLPSIALAVLVAVAVGLGILNEEIRPLVRALLLGFVFFMVSSQLLTVALARKAPQWGIAPFDESQSQRLGGDLIIILAWVALTAALHWMVEEMGGAPPELANVASVVRNTTIALLILPLLGRWLWRLPESEEREEEDRGLGVPLNVLRVVILLLLAAIPVTALFGYGEISDQMTFGLVFSGIAVGLLFIGRAALREASSRLMRPASSGAWVGRQLNLSEEGSERILFWFYLVVDLALIFLGLVLLMRAWGVPDTTLLLWIRQAFAGFQIGGVSISPGDILAALAVFIAALTVFRFLQRLLRDRVLARTRLDVGVQHSISAAAGYVGIALAVIMAIAALGLDLSNLALVAGALSVGIGFGLQNVVNNFVSGLLLLIERPVKVGDWIIVGGHEGTVKRISVRSTEIQTFDRAEVIVPNSELISTSVVNWTHKNRLCRIIIPVGVAYGTDTQKVHDVLLQAATEVDHITSVPAAYVLFRGFGDSALNFELRVYAEDTDYYMSVWSGLNFAVDRLFREHGIQIPFPQRDVHLRSGTSDASANQAPGRDSQPPAAGKDGPTPGSDQES